MRRFRDADGAFNTQENWMQLFHRTLGPLPLLLAAFWIGIGSASAATFRVGSGTGCSHATISAAINQALANGPESDSIRINAGTYAAQALSIADHSVSITGGFADCIESEPSGAPTLISGAGNGTQPVLSVTAPGATQRLVNLINLSLVDGAAGGLRAIGNMQMFLGAVTITGNTSIEGGGLYAQGASSTITPNIQIGGYDSEPSRIVNNTATRGGGIHVDSFAFVALSSVLVSNNTASLGGGLYINGSGSQVSMVGFPSSSLLGGILGNTATLDGGGLYLGSSAQFSSSRFSDESPAPLIAGNSAGRNGGGVFMAATGNSLLGYNLLIQGNTAGTSQNGNGGGVYLTAGNGALLADGGESTNCGRPDPCVSVENNRAGINGFSGAGGGVYVLGGSAFTAVNARVAGNLAQFGGAGYAIGSNAQMAFHSAIIEHNGGAGRSLQMDGGASLRLRGVTLANDDSAGGMIGLAGGTAEIDTSILYDPAAVIVFRTAMTSNAVTSNCVLAHAAYTSETGSAMVGNPLFIDVAAGNYQLSTGSPALDACATSAFTTADTDYAELPRGSDLPNVPNAPGPFDLGAFEEQAIVFADGFE